MIYLDNAATTMVCQQAAQSSYDTMTESFGNPSSTHKPGRQAKALLSKARAQLASAMKSEPEEIYFTSGGTESNNWALRSGMYLNRRTGRHIISSEAEHDSVIQTLNYLESTGCSITWLKPDSTGAVSAGQVKDALRPDTALVSLMAVNNETGAVTDIAAVADAIHGTDSKALLHTDAVQAFIKTPLNAESSGADLISVSGHKLHAPKGAGALYVKNGVKLPPFLFGGGQENEKRSGTEGLSQITAFGTAAELAFRSCDTDNKRMLELKQMLIESLNIPGISVIKSDAPHILCVSLPGYRAEVIMNYLDSLDIYVSRGSACKKGRRSHVLKSIGLPANVIDGSIRVSLSRYTTQNEISAFSRALKSAKDNILPAL